MSSSCYGMKAFSVTKYCLEVGRNLVKYRK
jgi:hypothetical protein